MADAPHVDRERQTEPRRVAVIAVHGVGHHNPREGARAAADLLARHTGGASYTTFSELAVRIPVEKVSVSPSNTATKAEGGWFDERSQSLRAASRHDSSAPQPEIDYMRDQLELYECKGEDSVYETSKLCAIRRDQKNGAEAQIHVFDMYWTDLSRVATTGLRMIGELYQLLFYVCGLGRKTMDFARAQYHGKGFALWTLAGTCQAYAERILVLFIPILNLCGLGLAVLLIPQWIYAKNDPNLIKLATGIACALLIFGTILILRDQFIGRSWPRIFWLVGLIALSTGLFLPDAIPAYMPLVLAELFWLAVAALIVALMAIYDRRRRGATGTSIFAVIAVAAMLLCPVVSKGMAGTEIAEAGLQVGHWVFIGLEALWAAFIILTVAVSAISFLAAHFAVGQQERDRARRVAWTADLSLTLPGFIVLLLNLALWRGCLGAADRFIDPAISEGVKDVIDQATPWSFAALLVLAALALISVVWALLPGIIDEVLPYRAAKRDPKPLGQTLNASFLSIRAAGEIVRWIVILALPVTLFLVDEFPPDFVEHLHDLSNDYTGWVGLALLAMLAGPGPFRALAMGLRTAIDVAIDVANWLRLNPRVANPRARICARYTSLLRYVLGWRDQDGAKFDAIVIFSHSQGTVISADLLRFFQFEPQSRPAGLDKVPICLFTMGCPLRQLYSLRFPHQYGWARHQKADWPGDKPSPTELGVQLWANAYRSGDYVGRYLWHADDDPAALNTAPNMKGERIEFCVGRGAHTHYWDDTAPAVADQLDSLIARV